MVRNHTLRRGVDAAVSKDGDGPVPGLLCPIPWLELISFPVQEPTGPLLIFFAGVRIGQYLFLLLAVLGCPGVGFCCFLPGRFCSPALLIAIVPQRIADEAFRHVDNQKAHGVVDFSVRNNPALFPDEMGDFFRSGIVRIASAIGDDLLNGVVVNCSVFRKSGYYF